MFARKAYNLSQFFVFVIMTRYEKHFSTLINFSWFSDDPITTKKSDDIGNVEQELKIGLKSTWYLKNKLHIILKFKTVIVDI